MNSVLLYKQIEAAMNSGDQLVFVYKKSDKDKVVRFVSPIEFVADVKLDEEIDLAAIKVLCVQHLPKEGFRHFFLDKIEEFQRVISRHTFANSSVFSNDSKAKDDSGEVD